MWATVTNMPAQPAAPAIVQAPTAQKHVASSKLHDENNVDEATINVQKAAAPTQCATVTWSSSAAEIESEEVCCTLEHPQNPEQFLELSDLVGSNNEEPNEVTALGK
jgi:hypothetical protein